MNVIFRIYLILCQKFDSKYTFGKKRGRIFKNSDAIQNLYHLSRNQIVKCNLAIIFPTIIMFIILFIISGKKLSIFILLTLLVLILQFLLNNLIEYQIKQETIRNIDYYRVFLLNLEILQKKSSIYDNTYSHILDFLHNMPTIGKNISESLLDVLLGGNILISLKKIHYYLPNFEKSYNRIIETGNIHLINQWTNVFEKELNLDFENYLQSLDLKLQLFTFTTLFYPILYLFSNIFYLNGLLDKMTFLLIFLLIQIFMIFRWELEYPAIIMQKRSTKNIYGIELFIDFLKQFCFHLQFNSPEFAIIKALDNNELNYFTKKDLVKIYESINPMEEVFNLFQSDQYTRPVRVLSNSFFQILKRNSQRGADYFKSVYEIFQKHRTLDNRRQIITDDMAKKSKVFKFVSSITIGIISPFIFMFQEILKTISTDFGNFSYFFEFSGNTTSLWVILFNSTYFVIIVFISFNRITTLSFFRKEDLIFFQIFILIFFITKNIVIFI